MNKLQEIADSMTNVFCKNPKNKDEVFKYILGCLYLATNSSKKESGENVYYKEAYKWAKERNLPWRTLDMVFHIKNTTGGSLSDIRKAVLEIVKRWENEGTIEKDKFTNTYQLI